MGHARTPGTATRGGRTKEDKGDGASGSSRSIAIIGPYLSGKTTLLEALLARGDSGEGDAAGNRPGAVGDGTSVGDSSPEARSHEMSIELNTATMTFLGDTYSFLDCPGSIEFRYDSFPALAGVDAAIVVCEADDKKVPALQLILKELEDQGIPRFLFLNKIDKAEARVRDVLAMLQPASTQPLVLRQIPIREDHKTTGFVDLALERAYVYREHTASEVVEIPSDLRSREDEARYTMLEHLADYDDALMEQLLEDIEPPRDRVFEDLRSELRNGDICPVFIGSAQNGHGILRLLKALRHEAPDVAQTQERLGVSPDVPCAQVLKTIHTQHAGKLSLVRVLGGTFSDGDTVQAGDVSARISGIFTLTGQDVAKRGPAQAGETVAFGRLDDIPTGATITLEKEDVPAIAVPAPPAPVYGLALNAKERKDEVKLTSAITKLMDEDPSLTLEHNQALGEMVLRGQGEMHLRVAKERLARKFGIEALTHPPRVPYKETVRKSAEVRGRHKKQSGGHGQFGDVVVDIAPLPRGEGVKFSDTITGGVVPKQYIPSVETGARDYLSRGPLGFEVVDVAICLKDGSYHSVDSSDQAFKSAGRLAMAEGIPQCGSVLLEPVMTVTITIPSDATAKANAIVSSRRGQILGFDARNGWTGWDEIQAHIPQAELQDMIIELRSATAGVGTFTANFDHLAELSGRLADQVVDRHTTEAA